MVETKHYCDICGKEINIKRKFPFYLIQRKSRSRVFGAYGYFTLSDEFVLNNLLICDDCWKNIKEYCKEKKED